MDQLRELVNQQAEDDGLWFQAQTAPEAYLQQELRKLHAAVESSAPTSPEAPPLDLEALKTCDYLIRVCGHVANGESTPRVTAAQFAIHLEEIRHHLVRKQGGV